MASEEKVLEPAFQAALDQAGLVPRGGVNAFLTAWTEFAVAKRVPRPVFAYLIAQFDGFVEIFVFGGVAGVVSDGLLRLIVPTILLLPGHHVPPEEIAAGLAQWVASGAGDILVKFAELREEASR